MNVKGLIMSTVDIRQELKDFISQEDDKSLKKFYKMAKAYMEQRREDKLMAEAEEDIKEGRIHSQEDVKDLIKRWAE